MANKKYSDKQLAKAKQLYMEYQSLDEIERRTKIPRGSVYHHVKSKWKDEREMNKAELFAQMTATKKVHFTNMTSATIKILTRALEDLANRDQAPTIVEATKAAEIMNTLDKITRLDEGNPTDIVSNQEKPMTIEVIKEKIALDPFSVEEIEYKGEDENESH